MGAISKKRKAAEVPPCRFPHGHLLVLESAALGTALGGNIPAASIHADALGTATVVAVVRAALYLTLDVRFHRGFAAGSVLGTARTTLLKRSAAGLAGFLGGRAVHLDPGKAAVVVLDRKSVV